MGVGVAVGGEAAAAERSWERTAPVACKEAATSVPFFPEGSIAWLSG